MAEGVAREPFDSKKKYRNRNVHLIYCNNKDKKILAHGHILSAS